MMKKIVGYIGAWSLYWMGDGISRLMNTNFTSCLLYRVYNKLMCWSCAVQDWAGLEQPWRKVDEDVKN